MEIDETEVKCPDCGSKDIEPLNSPTGKEWECSSCGFVFDQDDLDEEE
jgi:rubredoxin